MEAGYLFVYKSKPGFITTLKYIGISDAYCRCTTFFSKVSQVEVKRILAGNIILALMEWGVTGERKPNCLCRLQRQTLSSLYSPRPEDWHYEIATDWSPPVAQEACSHSCFLRQVELKFWDLGFAGCANRLHCSIVSPTMGVHTSHQ